MSVQCAPIDKDGLENGVTYKESCFVDYSSGLNNVLNTHNGYDDNST